MTDRSIQSRITVRTLQRWAQAGTPFAMITCYDATTALHLARADVPCLLVGDTAAQMILGHDSTLPAPLDFMLHITAAVRRGAPLAFVMADMPFGSYQCGDDEAMRHAVRFIAEAGADAVKLEVDASFGPLVSRMASAGIPVVAHVGSRPQQVRAKGGYRAEGRTQAEAAKIIDLASRMVDHGAAMLLVEAVPAGVSRRIVEAVNVPVIGCGAGPACPGHVIVLHDLLGLTDWHPPFAPPLTDLGRRIEAAAGQWVQLVASGKYLRDDHPYHFDS